MNIKASESSKKCQAEQYKTLLIYYMTRNKIPKKNFSVSDNFELIKNCKKKYLTTITQNTAHIRI